MRDRGTERSALKRPAQQPASVSRRVPRRCVQAAPVCVLQVLAPLTAGRPAAADDRANRSAAIIACARPGRSRVSLSPVCARIRNASQCGPSSTPALPRCGGLPIQTRSMLDAPSSCRMCSITARCWPLPPTTTVAVDCPVDPLVQVHPANDATISAAANIRRIDGAYVPAWSPESPCRNPHGCAGSPGVPHTGGERGKRRAIIGFSFVGSSDPHTPSLEVVGVHAVGRLPVDVPALGGVQSGGVVDAGDDVYSAVCGSRSHKTPVKRTRKCPLYRSSMEYRIPDSNRCYRRERAAS